MAGRIKREMTYAAPGIDIDEAAHADTRLAGPATLVGDHERGRPRDLLSPLMSWGSASIHGGCTNHLTPCGLRDPPAFERWPPPVPLRKLAVGLILEGKTDRAASDLRAGEDMAWNVPWTTAAAARTLRPQIDTNEHRRAMDIGQEEHRTKRNVFVSYRREHQDLVDLFCAQFTCGPVALSLYEYSPKIASGDEWRLNVERIIRSCAATICLVGDTTYRSEPVNWEIRRSTALGKAVLGVYLQSVTASIPPALSEIGVTPLPWNVAAIKEELYEQPD